MAKFASRGERRRFEREQRRKDETEDSDGKRLIDGKEQFVNHRRWGD